MEQTYASLPEKILQQLGPLIRDRVLINEREFLISRPEHSERRINFPSSHAGFEGGQSSLFWADLWPSARMLAKVILRETWAPGLEAMEIGCGLGLAGIAALSAGLRVTFSDYHPCALQLAADNARLNGFSDFRTLLLDWRHPPAGLQVQVILGSDLIYETSNVPFLVDFIKCILAPDGLCLLTDQDRVPARALRDTLTAQGLPFTTQTVRAGEPGRRRLKGTLYRIHRQ